MTSSPDRSGSSHPSDGFVPSELAAMSLEDLRSRRSELQTLDDVVSYVRRVAQGRADLARDALERASDDGDPTPVYMSADMQEGLREVLSDRLLAAGDRPPRPADDFSDHPLSGELDGLCATHGFSRINELNRAGLKRLVVALDVFEQQVSAQRQTVFAELDELTEELVTRYREAAGSEYGDGAVPPEVAR